METITKEKMAEVLNGREYREEITREEIQLAKNSRLVVVYGASDDLCELNGAIDEELDCWNGGKATITRDGEIAEVLMSRKLNCDSDERRDCPCFKIWMKQFKEQGTATLEAIWGEEDYSWTYKLDIPYATFDVVEDDRKYCRGVVFSLTDICNNKVSRS